MPRSLIKKSPSPATLQSSVDLASAQTKLDTPVNPESKLIASASDSALKSGHGQTAAVRTNQALASSTPDGSSHHAPATALAHKDGASSSARKISSQVRAVPESSTKAEDVVVALPAPQPIPNSALPMVPPTSSPLEDVVTPVVHAEKCIPPRHSAKHRKNTPDISHAVDATVCEREHDADPTLAQRTVTSSVAMAAQALNAMDAARTRPAISASPSLAIAASPSPAIAASPSPAIAASISTATSASAAATVYAGAASVAATALAGAGDGTANIGAVNAVGATAPIGASGLTAPVRAKSLGGRALAAAKKHSSVLNQLQEWHELHGDTLDVSANLSNHDGDDAAALVAATVENALKSKAVRHHAAGANGSASATSAVGATRVAGATSAAGAAVAVAASADAAADTDAEATDRAIYDTSASGYDDSDDFDDEERAPTLDELMARHQFDEYDDDLGLDDSSEGGLNAALNSNLDHELSSEFASMHVTAGKDEHSDYDDIDDLDAYAPYSNYYQQGYHHDSHYSQIRGIERDYTDASYTDATDAAYTDNSDDNVTAADTRYRAANPVSDAGPAGYSAYSDTDSDYSDADSDYSATDRDYSDATDADYDNEPEGHNGWTSSSRALTNPSRSARKNTSSGSNIGAFIKAANQVPMLTEPEERVLAARYRETEDLDAARRLVLSHLRLVVSVARGYMGYGLPLPDLIQEGNIGLMKAVKHFEPSVGVRLAAFAVYWIKAEISEYVIRNWRMVKIATTKDQRKIFFNLRQNKKRLGWFTEKERKEMADNLKVKDHEVAEMEKRLAGMDVGFDQDEEDSGDRNSATALAPASYLEDENSNFAQVLENSDFSSWQLKKLHAALNALDERARYIIKRRWLDDNKATLQELARELSISIERVRQLENNAMNKIRSMLINDGISSVSDVVTPKRLPSPERVSTSRIKRMSSAAGTASTSSSNASTTTSLTSSTVSSANTTSSTVTVLGASPTAATSTSSTSPTRKSSAKTRASKSTKASPSTKAAGPVSAQASPQASARTAIKAVDTPLLTVAKRQPTSHNRSLVVVSQPEESSDKQVLARANAKHKPDASLVTPKSDASFASPDLKARVVQDAVSREGATSGANASGENAAGDNAAGVPKKKRGRPLGSGKKKDAVSS